MEAHAAAAFRNLQVSQLAPHPPLDAAGRLPTSSIPLYTAVSTQVANLLAVGDRPLLPPVSDEHAWMVVELLERDEKLDERVRETHRARYFQAREQERFLNTFGAVVATHRPLVKLCQVVTLFDYVVETRRQMLSHCTTVGSVDPLIFVGERDWESLDAWERSKVTLAARDYTSAHPHLYRLAGSASAPLSARPCDVAWGKLDYSLELPRLTLASSGAGWKRAFEVRDQLLHFLMSPSSFLKHPTVEEAQEKIFHLMSEAMQQSHMQSEPDHWTAERVPKGVESRMAYLRSLTGVATPIRPFTEFMTHPLIEPQLGTFVKGIASKMVHSATRLEQARRAVYFCGRWWSSLDPLQKAWAVLEARDYLEWIKSSAPVRRGSAEAPIELDLGHHYRPSLTSRQARRSAVSERALRERWD